MTKLRAQRLLKAARELPASDKVKFDGLKRLDIARNIERMFDVVSKFEREVGVLQRGILPGEKNIEANNAIVDRITALSLEEVEFKLIALDVGDLRVDDNAALDPDVIAALAPMIRGFDSMKDDDSD